MRKIILLKNKERSILLKHPWIFSGAIDPRVKLPEDGSLVRIESNSGEFLAIGYYHRGSIAVRILSFNDIEIDKKFWEYKIHQAFKYRQDLSIYSSDSNNTYRLFNAEGDGVPGLVIDYYAGYCVVQTHSSFIAGEINRIGDALFIVFGDDLNGVFWKNTDASADTDSTAFNGQTTHEHTVVIENRLKFIVNWKEGQKTGFFLDQRENRLLVRESSQGRKVLNCFAYSGGFSVNALKGGAKFVDSVDSSAKASAWMQENICLNFKDANHAAHTQDVISYLQQCTNKYDLLILDPPAYAKRRSALKKAEQGYRRLHQLSFPLMESGSLMFTYSCSQAVDMINFKRLVFQAAADSGREVKIIKQLHQAADHPINLFHPEGEYLKGLMLYIS